MFCAIAERDAQRCPMCRGALKRHMSVPQPVMFKGEWYHFHGPEDAAFVTSKRQLFEECRKRGKYAEGHDQERKLNDANDPQKGYVAQLRKRRKRREQA